MSDAPRSADPTDAVRAALAEPRPYTLDEIAAHAELPTDELAAVFEALGRLDRAAFGDRDRRYAELVAELRRYLPLETLVRSARVRRRSIGSIVSSDLTTVREHVLGPALEHADAPGEVSEALEGAALALVPLEAELLALDYRGVLEDLLATDLVARAATNADRELEAAIGFVDLVGYTELTAGASASQLNDAVAEFEDLVHAQVSRSHCTYAVKFIGDAAMLLSEELDDLVEVVLDIVDADAGLPDLPRRGGISAGPVLVREGDYFGTTVNLAARLTSVARPWSVLVDQELTDDLDELLDVKRIPPVKLRGIGGRRPVRVKRGDHADDG